MLELGEIPRFGHVAGLVALEKFEEVERAAVLVEPLYGAGARSFRCFTFGGLLFIHLFSDFFGDVPATRGRMAAVAAKHRAATEWTHSGATIAYSFLATADAFLVVVFVAPTVVGRFAAFTNPRSIELARC